MASARDLADDPGGAELPASEVRPITTASSAQVATQAREGLRKAGRLVDRALLRVLGKLPDIADQCNSASGSSRGQAPNDFVMAELRGDMVKELGVQ